MFSDITKEHGLPSGEIGVYAEWHHSEESLVHPFSNGQQNVSNVLNSSLARLNSKDPVALQAISNVASTNDPVVTLPPQNVSLSELF